LQSFALFLISHSDLTSNYQLFLQLRIRAEAVTDRESSAYSTKALQQWLQPFSSAGCWIVACRFSDRR
jgi:hypothetical protein